MATANINGARLGYEISGTGEIPLVLVHGGLLSRRNWDWVVPHLAESFRVLTYDCRGHGESERPRGGSSIQDDVADLAALIEHLGLAPAWVAGQSSGGNIVLRLAAQRPDLLRGITAHEPGFFTLIEDDPDMAPMLERFDETSAEVIERIESGDHAAAAEHFVEEGLGRGLWTQFPPEFRQDVIENAATFVDEVNDPDELAFDLEWISEFDRPALLTLGDQTSPLFPPIIARLAEAMPSAEVQRFEGAGHVIQVEQPEDYAEAIESFIRKNDSQL